MPHAKTSRRKIAALEKKIEDLIKRDEQMPPRREASRTPIPRRMAVQTDWNCSCGEYVYAERHRCRKCHAPRYTGAPVSAIRGLPTASSGNMELRPATRPRHSTAHHAIHTPPVSMPMRARTVALRPGPQRGTGATSTGPAWNLQGQGGLGIDTANARVGTHTGPTAEQPQPAAQRMAGDDDAQLQGERQDEYEVDDTVDETVAEIDTSVVEPKRIAWKIGRLQQRIERLEKRQTHEIQEVEAQRSFIEEQERVLKGLEDKVELTKVALRERRDDAAALSARQTELLRASQDQGGSEREKLGDAHEEAPKPLQQILYTAASEVRATGIQDPRVDALIAYMGQLFNMAGGQDTVAGTTDPKQTTLDGFVGLSSTPPALSPPAAPVRPLHHDAAAPVSPPHAAPAASGGAPCQKCWSIVCRCVQPGAAHNTDDEMPVDSHGRKRDRSSVDEAAEHHDGDHGEEAQETQGSGKESRRDQAKEDRAASKKSFAAIVDRIPGVSSARSVPYA